MGRSITGVVVGYLVIFAFVFVTFSIAYPAMGTERSFQPGSYAVSGLWIALSLILGLLAAIIGGVVCTALARGGRAYLVLALVVGARGVLVGGRLKRSAAASA